MRPVVVNEDNESIVRQKLCGEESEKPVRFKLTLAIKYESAKEGAHLRKDTYLFIVET
jgi:hypothetical protein